MARIRLAGALVLATVLAGSITARAAATATHSLVTHSHQVGDDELYGVSCTSRTWCMAVGDRNFRPLAELWNGSAWRVLPMPEPTSLVSAHMSQVSCRTINYCLAVGYHYQTAGGNTAILAEQWNGASWQLVQSANPVGASSGFLNNVSCRTSAGCIAVGGEAGPSGAGQAMAALWSAGSWRFLPVPEPTAARRAALRGISCSIAYCLAVGLYQNAGGQVLPLADSWAGSSLSLLSPANASLPISEFDGVSCLAPGSCIAVGFGYRAAQQPFSEIWMNGRWRIVPGGRLRGGALTGISCPGQARCIAVGAVAGKPLAEEWNGRGWRVLPVTGTSGASGHPAADFSQVSCRRFTSWCLTVGAYYQPGRVTGRTTLVEILNNKSYTVIGTKNP